MNFSDLYINNKKDVENKIATLWGGEAYTDAQKAQVKILKAKIGEIFAPNDAVPVVQCMNSYKSVHSVSADDAKALVGSLWTSEYDPYEHQYASWNTLLNEQYEEKPMSICVTTGTGSGKTECFMMPLVYDLANNYQEGQIQAIFLYPLNALMEDQKERLEKMLENIEQSTGVHLTYTVYNGDLPDEEFADDNMSEEAVRTRRKIEQIRGLITDNQGQPILDADGNKQYKFPRMVYTRRTVRKAGHAPNILLTNPTMLEYILLRKSDENLLNPQMHSLRWVAIDETHTYSGAGAAELAMLLRRVMIAFDMDAQNVRFATSSATFANGDTEEQKAKAEQDLKKFISDLTGTSFNQVKVIDGIREGEELLGQDCGLPDEDKKLWKKLCHDDYVELDKLFPEGTISEKLGKLDEMCQRVEEIYEADKKKEEETGKKAKILMKCKVHYFYRVPNNGFYVRLNEHQDGAFEVYTQKPLEQDNSKLPLLELTRCKHCGEFLAVGMVEKPDGKLYAMESDDSDMFDLGSDDDPSDLKQTVFALSNKPITDTSRAGSYDIEGANIKPSTNSSYRPNEWHLIGNEYHECPCCRKKLTKSESKKKDSDAEEVVEDMRLQKLRLSADFISRILAPSTLDQLDESTSTGSITLHQGQQYISFVDSRQAAAISTMNQNLEQERLWFYSTIYKKLAMMGEEKESLRKKLDELNIQYDNCTDRNEKRDIDRKILEIDNKVGKNYLDWDEIADLLFNDEYFMVFCHQFIKRTEDSEDLNSDGSIKEEAKLKYLYSIMVLYLGNRPATAASHETMGLFRPCYPFLSDLKIPQSVEKFNNELQYEENKIGDKDWQDFIQVFLDYTVRSNQSIFLSMTGAGNKHMYDIFSCERYATEKPRRRPVHKPKFEKKGDTSDSRIVRYLSGLITKDHNLSDDNETQRKYFDIIHAVVEDFWKVLTENGILEQGTHYDESDPTKQIPDKDNTAMRFNLAKMALTLYDDVYLCDTNTDGNENHVSKWRPIQVNFKGFSPYLIGNRAVSLKEEYHQHWDCYDGYKDGVTYNLDSLKDWARQNRSLLWDNNLWGEDGVFSDRLEMIHLTPNLFIQAEHTAQVDKMVARKLQEQFKDHSINILACSTTMEMGVDLGNLEVVMLTSVPPLPANYKQRAGRSGRNNKVKSVCVTLCGSDAIGLRTLRNPLETIIMRPVDVPSVDLMSQQVVKRHAIAYLIRSFGVFAAGENGGSLNQTVLDFYTPFRTVRARGEYTKYYNDTHEISPDDGMGDPTNTNYMRFDKACSQSISNDMKRDFEKLLKDTPYVNSYSEVLREARKENKRCYDELSSKVEDIRQTVRNADPNSKGYGSYMNLLKMEYMEILTQKLLTYWATNRFTPNANMPVNIMSLDLNATKLKSKNDVKRGVSNPSYTLRQAIQQYVPGNSIVVDGVVYIVRGLTTQDAYNSGRTIKKLFRNANKTVVGEDVTLDSPIPWTVNDKIGVNFVQPVRFLPDPNEDYSRVMDDNVYTHVSAQLIGTKDWGNKITEPNLFSTRRSDETGNANILYYNEGIGHGYAMCVTCGKMCLETGPVDEGVASIPRDIDDRQNDRGGRYHFAIDREKKHPCFGSGKKEYIKRNVIIGDLMQTDYCEIRIRHTGDTSWMTFSTNKDVDEKNTNLLITLGIVFTQSLIELKGWEKGAVDFAVMQNRHLCIFDTNPGGSGYSIKLNDNQTMLDVIAASKKLLQKAKDANAKDMLLDKFTLRFIRRIDIDGALNWIEEQENTVGVFPSPIPEVFNTNDVRLSSMQELLHAFGSSNTSSTIFVDDNYVKWDYGTATYGWQTRLLGEFFYKRNNTTFCVACKKDASIPEGALQMLRSIEAIFGTPVKIDYLSDKQLYPLAYIDGRLYFTINDESSTLNECWGDGMLYCIKTENPAGTAQRIDCSFNAETTQIFFLNDDKCEDIHSKDLGKIIHTHDDTAKSIIDRFIEHCKSTEGNLYISYQDEHLKSVASFVLTLQTIEYFANLIKKKFKLEFFIEEYEYGNQKRGIFANIQDSDKRDDKLVEIINHWMNDFDHVDEVEDIESKNSGELTHWRVLNFEYNGKRLSIYPDGGLLNGWGLGILKPGERYDYYDTTTDDNIPLHRQNDIKFEVHIEDIK